MSRIKSLTLTDGAYSLTRFEAGHDNVKKIESNPNHNYTVTYNDGSITVIENVPCIASYEPPTKKENLA
jgi:hypothetical protein